MRPQSITLSHFFYFSLSDSRVVPAHALWFRTTKNRVESTRRAHSPAPHCSLRSCTLLLFFTCSALLATLAHSVGLLRLLACSLIHSQTRGKVNDSMSDHQAVLNHSGMVDGDLDQSSSRRRGPRANREIVVSARQEYPINYSRQRLAGFSVGGL